MKHIDFETRWIKNSLEKAIQSNLSILKALADADSNYNGYILRQFVYNNMRFPTYAQLRRSLERQVVHAYREEIAEEVKKIQESFINMDSDIKDFLILNSRGINSRIEKRYILCYKREIKTLITKVCNDALKEAEVPFSDRRFYL